MYDDLVDARLTPGIVALIAGVAACASPPASTACLSRTDCTGTEECIAGRCVASDVDAGPGHDAATVPTDAGLDVGPDQDAFAEDAGIETDAFSEPDAAEPAPGDSCANPITLTLDAMGHAHAEGELAAYGHDYDTYCDETGAPDLVYAIELPPGTRDVEITTAGPTDTVVAFSETCAGSGEFYSCNDDRSPDDHHPRMILHRFGSSQLFVLVGGYGSGDIGPFALDVSVTSVADSSSCATTGIDLTGGAYVVAWSPATNMAPTPSCLGAPLVSDVYRVDRMGQMTVESINAYFGDVQGAIALVDDCSAPVTESWCEVSSWTDSSYFGLGASAQPFQAPDVGYFVVSAGPASTAYTFEFYP